MSRRLLEEFRERAEALVPMPDLDELQQRGARRRRVRTSAGAAVVASAVAIGAAVVTNQDERVISPAAAQAAAESLMTAWEAGDDDAVAAAFTPVGRWDDYGSGQLLAEHDWYRAAGWEVQGTGCSTQGTSPVGVVSVACTYTFENDLTRALGRPPVDAELRLVIEDGGIRRARTSWDIADYRDIWETFIGWVIINHPEDFDRMYYPEGSGHLNDATSIELWDRYTDEFTADFAAASEPYIARAESICSSAHFFVNREFTGYGYELEPATNDADSLEQIPVSEQGTAVYDATTRRALSETLSMLRNVPPPDALRSEFEHDYALLEGYARGREAPLTSPSDYWIHQIERHDIGLAHCTFSLAR